MPKTKAPEHVLKRLNKGREPKEKAQLDMAKTNGIVQKGNRYKVFLDTHGKRVYVGTYKTLELAEEALDNAERNAE